MCLSPSICAAGRGDQHAEAGFVVQREAARRPQAETGHRSSERAQEQLQQRLARHADLCGVSLKCARVCVCCFIHQHRCPFHASFSHTHRSP